MVNNISFSGAIGSNPTSKDIENIAKYTVGTNLVNSEEGPLDGSGLFLGLTGLYEGGKVGKHFWDARKTEGGVSNAWQAEKDTFNKELNIQKDLMKDGGWKEANSYKTLWNNFELKTIKDSIPSEDVLKKLATGTDKAQVANKNYNRVSNLMKFAEANPDKKADAIRIANKALAKANAAAHGEIPAENFLSKVGGFLGKYTGYSKTAGFMKNLAVESPTIAKVMKFGKGSGPFLAISGIAELVTQVVPSFVELGPEKGIKQLLKSSVKTVASVGGWAAGAAAGAAIGSVIPGAGTVIGGAIGAIVGFVGGCVGSWGASKVAEKVVGKNELEIAEENKAKEVAKQAMQNPDQIATLMAAAGQKFQANGGASKDDQIALASLKRIAAQRQAAQTIQTNQFAQAPQIANNSYSADIFNPFQNVTSPNLNINPYQTNLNGGMIN